MGPNQSTIFPQGQPLTHYDIVQKDPDNNLTFLRHKITTNEYLLKQFAINDKQQFNSLVQTLKGRKKIQSSYLTKLQRYSQQLNDNYCSTYYKVFTMWEFPNHTLYDEIKQRLKQNKKFQQNQLFSIIACTIQAMSCLQSNGIKHQNLTTMSIRFDEQGAIKITDPLTSNSTNFEQINTRRTLQNIYLSPQQCQSLKNQRPIPNRNPFKSDVFVLGLILLECGLLQSLSGIYIQNYQDIDFDKLNKKIEDFSRFYTRDLKVTIETMLAIDTKQRMDWLALKQYIPQKKKNDNAGKEAKVVQPLPVHRQQKGKDMNSNNKVNNFMNSLHNNNKLITNNNSNIINVPQSQTSYIHSSYKNSAMLPLSNYQAQNSFSPNISSNQGNKPSFYLQTKPSINIQSIRQTEQIYVPSTMLKQNNIQNDRQKQSSFPYNFLTAGESLNNLNYANNYHNSQNHQNNNNNIHSIHNNNGTNLTNLNQYNSANLMNQCNITNLQIDKLNQIPTNHYNPFNYIKNANNLSIPGMRTNNQYKASQIIQQNKKSYSLNKVIINMNNANNTDKIYGVSSTISTGFNNTNINGNNYLNSNVSNMSNTINSNINNISNTINSNSNNISNTINSNSNNIGYNNSNNIGYAGNTINSDIRNRINSTDINTANNHLNLNYPTYNINTNINTSSYKSNTSPYIATFSHQSVYPSPKPLQQYKSSFLPINNNVINLNSTNSNMPQIKSSSTNKQEDSSLSHSPFASNHIKDATSILYDKFEKSNITGSFIDNQKVNNSNLVQNINTYNNHIISNQHNNNTNTNTNTNNESLKYGSKFKYENNNNILTNNHNPFLYQPINLKTYQDNNMVTMVNNSLITNNDNNINNNNINNNNTNNNNNINNNILKQTQKYQYQSISSINQHKSGYKSNTKIESNSSISQQLQQNSNNKNSNSNKINNKTQNNENNNQQQQLQYIVQHFKQGSRYEGTKLNDQRHGQGKFFYQDGGMYDGNWKHNKMDGYGKLYYQSGKIAYEGNWKNDQFQAYGKLYNQLPDQLNQQFDYQNFDMIDQFWVYYQGNFQYDQKNGQGKMIFSNGQQFCGTFCNDMVDGPGQFHTKTGMIIKGVWNQNQLVQVQDQDQQ